MSIISYAQNSEDVMLWRALKHIENGFYIDVGANDPVEDSVTKLFYDNGWSGINIEPLKSHYLDLESQRPRDINISCAAGSEDGQLELWECEIRGWATTEQKTIEMHESAGHKGNYHTVPVMTLKRICSEHVNKEVHFLKIDVEGFEEAVLKGMDFSLYRPWILIIEATKPNSVEENFCDWEEIVISSNYILAYKDGLNRFYVAEERNALLDNLKYPPNVLDNFIKYQQVASELRAQQAEAKAEQAEAKAEQAEAKAEQAEAKAEHYASELQLFYSSSSWRVTAPLRWVSFQLNLFKTHGLKARLQALRSKTTRKVVSFINKNPAIKKNLVKLFSLLGKKEWLKKMYLNSLANSNSKKIEYHYYDVEELTPQARRIYSQLKEAIKNNKDLK